jgi:hypothetical protein
MSDNWFAYRVWTFHADMNGDGHLSVTDVWLWMKWLYFMPGDAAIAIFGPTSIGRFFELSHASFGGAGSGIFSFFMWPVILILIRNVFRFFLNPFRRHRVADKKARDV